MTEQELFIFDLVKTHKEMRKGKVSNEKLFNLVIDIVENYSLLDLTIIVRILRTVMKTYYGKIGKLTQGTKTEFHAVYSIHLEKLNQEYQTAFKHNPESIMDNGRILSLLMNIIEADSRLYFGYAKLKNPTPFLSGDGWTTLRCRTPKELLAYYQIQRNAILYKICEANITFEIPFDQLENYLTFVRRSIPLIPPDRIKSGHSQWGNEVGIRTSTTGLIADSQLWADFSSVGTVTSKAKIKEEERLLS